MVEAVREQRSGTSWSEKNSFPACKVAATLIKGIVVVFPLPAAFLTGAPPEMKIAAVYCSLVSLALFVALGEIAAGIRHTYKILAQQRCAP